MRIGAALFDNNNIRGRDQTLIALDGAWASISGGNPRRIESIHDLPNDIIWYTSLMFADYNQSRLARHPNFRGSDWLRTAMPLLLAEFGLDEPNATRGMAAKYMALLSARVLKVSNKRFGLVPANPFALAEDFSVAFDLPRPRLPEEMQAAFHSLAEHYYVQVVSDVSTSTRQSVMRLTRNRLVHAREMLSVPLPPDIGWQNIKIQKDNSDAWLDTLTTPFIARVRIKNINPAVADIMSFGSGGKQIKEWMTDIEWRVYREHCTIDIVSVFACKNDELVIHPMAGYLPTGILSELSPTFGIIAENMWLSLCKGFRSGSSAPPKYTAAAAYLRAIDRITLFKIALQLATRGISINSYSTGSISVFCPENDIGRIVNIASQYGLLPPRSKIFEHERKMQSRPEHQRIPITSPPKELGLVVLDHHLRTNVNTAQYFDIDERIINDALTDEERHQYLAEQLKQNTTPMEA